jgi:hypothetical protein
MGRFIVGFDTISYYVPVVYKWVNGGVGFYGAMAYAPLFYGMLVGLFQLGVPLTFSLKILPPVLLGSLGLVIYGYSNKVLVWSSWKSLLVSLLATTYFVALRISWDMLRSELALIFLFLFLIVLFGNHGGGARGLWRGFALVSPAMVLVVLSQQLVSVVMFAVVLGVVLQRVLRHEFAAVRNLVFWAVPAAMVFGLVIYSGVLVSPGFSVVSGFPSRDLGGWFSLFGFDSYAGMAADALGFLVFCFAFLLPFAYLGFRGVKRVELWVWLATCLALALFPIVSPWAFVVGGYRWTLLLVFPLAFLAVEGLSRLGSNLLKKAFYGAMILLSLSFVALPAEAAFPFFGLFPNYVPSSMLQNSVSLRDCEDVVKVLSWYDGHIGLSGTLLVHDAFQGWARLFLSNSSQVVSYGYGDSERAAQGLVSQGFARVFLIWWVSGEGWHGTVSLPASFVTVFRSNDIAVYSYNAGV